MKILALVSLLVSTTASASTILWGDLTDDAPLYLTQGLPLTSTRGEAFRVEEGTEYFLESLNPLPGLPVVEFIFRPKNCPYPSLESELEMILPNENTPTSKSEVGVFFLKNCFLEVMVENKDLYSASFLKD